MKLELTPYDEPSKSLESSSEYSPPTAAPVDVGSRHHTALSLACSLISRGTPQTDLATIMNAVNQTYNPPLEQREVDALLRIPGQDIHRNLRSHIVPLYPSWARLLYMVCRERL